MTAPPTTDPEGEFRSRLSSKSRLSGLSAMSTDGAPEPTIDDDDLIAQALAADPAATIADDAVAFGWSDGDTELLPSWYMPAPAGRRPSRRRAVVLIALIVAMVVVDGAGLCATYGLPEIAW